MKKLKVMTIVGTRPEIIRLSHVMKALEQSDSIEHILVHTGQNYDYELNQVFFDDFGLRKPDDFLDSAGETALSTIGNVLIKIEEVLKKHTPEALLVLGDTNSCFAALAAKKMKIPVFHMEAGNRCFDQRVPEEINRKVVDHISDINITYSTIARNYLLQENFPPERIIKVGSPMKEVLMGNIDNIEKSDVLSKLSLENQKYMLVSTHRAENVDETSKLEGFLKVLNELCEKYNMPIIVSTHPRTKKRMESLDVKMDSNIKFLKPFGFFDYVKLQKEAFVTLSDSGTISEESSILNFPAVNLRETHERPEAMEEASVMMTGYNPDRIFQAIELLAQQKRGEERTLRPVYDYSVDNVSEKVVRIIISYVDYINKKIWFK